MKKNIIAKIFVLAFIATTSTSCEGFLDIAPNDQITGDNFYQSEEDFQAATGPLYNKVWFDFNDKFYYALGDGRSGNLYAPYSDYVYPFADLLETGLTGPLVSAWQSFYNVIQQSNNVIIGIEKSSVSEEIKTKYIAEARFMRGTAYWYIASLWGDAIISTDPGALVSNPIVPKNNFEDVYEFAIRDFEYAAKYLPETSGQAGRLNRYSAFAMLSRLYLAYSGVSENPNSGTRSEEYLELAKKAALMVIEKSAFKLLPNYENLFDIDYNNNVESIFALQWVPNGDYGVTNTQQAYFAAGSEITGDDAAWGYWTRATTMILGEYETGDIRRKETWMTAGDYYADINKANGGYTHLPDITSATYCNVKKGVVGSTKDNTKITRMNSALNTYMIRLAEVYLNYAEAVLGNSATSSDADALAYVNQLRVRAGVPEITTLSYEILRKERRLELCMEGQYWYDLVSRAYYKQQEVLNYIKAQDRGVIKPIIYDGATNTMTSDASRNDGTRPIGAIDETILLLPIPESELVQNPLLKGEAVPYEFTEERIADLF
ncbi:MAG: RagB/SusD family nutrient uptake outer membrane protein [Mangrovibacterium sp.]